MIYEIIIIICLAAVIIIFLRKLPKTKTGEEKESLKPQPFPLRQSFSEARSFFEKAERLFKAQNFPNAEKYYLQAATRQPKNFKIYQRLGEIYLKQRNFKDAKDAFRSALDLKANCAFNYFNLGKAYLGLKDRKNAQISFKKAAELEPENRIYQKIVKGL